MPDLESYRDKDWPEDAKIFAAMVTRMDRDVGRILDLVDELGIGEKTIVFFCSDNGSAFVWQGLFDSCGPLREKKGSLYDGGIRTPMVVRQPGKVPAGEVSEAVWYFADFLPTAAELAGVNAPETIDGISMAEALYAAETTQETGAKTRKPLSLLGGPEKGQLAPGRAARRLEGRTFRPAQASGTLRPEKGRGRNYERGRQKPERR